MDKKIQIDEFLNKKIQERFIEKYTHIEDNKYKVIKKFQNVAMEFDVRVKENESEAGEPFVIIFDSVFDKEDKKLKTEIDEIYKSININYNHYKNEIDDLKMMLYSLFLHVIGSRRLSEKDLEIFGNKIFNEIES